jgi:hypothetical protein
VSKRAVVVLEIEDFMCRCGKRVFDKQLEGQTTVGLTCRTCGRRYSVKKKEKKTRMTNLPMSFGFRSLYWDKFESSRGSLYGVTEQGYEIREIQTDNGPSPRSDR